MKVLNCPARLRTAEATVKPNVLLVILDSVRARNVSLYGGDRETTPRLSDLAEEATVYTQARAPSVSSLYSHPSLFTGLHVAEHNVTKLDHRLAPGHTIWETLLEEHGYATAVFSMNTFATGREQGFTRGFEDVVRGGELLEDLPFRDGLDPRNEYTGNSLRAYLGKCLTSDAPLRSLGNAVAFKAATTGAFPHRSLFGDIVPFGDYLYEKQFLQWHDERGGPWAACINFHDAHAPYVPAPEHNRWGDDRLLELQAEVGHGSWPFYAGDQPWWIRRAYESLYDGCIHQVDERVGRIVDALKRRGDFDDTLLVVTSDHGEAFGEVSRVQPKFTLCGHGAGIHEVKTHVPLVAKFPAQSRSEVIDEASTSVRFRRAVERTLAGEWDPKDFVPDGPVIVSAPVNPDPDHLRSHGIDPEPFQGDAHAVYQDASDGVIKRMSWRSREATVVVRDAQTSYKINEDCGDAVERALADLSDAGVRERSAAELDDLTEHRLRRLGYIE